MSHSRLQHKASIKYFCYLLKDIHKVGRYGTHLATNGHDRFTRWRQGLVASHGLHSNWHLFYTLTGPEFQKQSLLGCHSKPAVDDVTGYSRSTGKHLSKICQNLEVKLSMSLHTLQTFVLPESKL